MDLGLERLTNTLHEMASLSEKSVATAIEGYASGQKVRAQIADWSDKLLALNEEAGEFAVELIARYQPVASDLRFIKSCLEIAYGFSRFGRYALDIAEVLETFGDLGKCDHSTVLKVGEKVKLMMGKSIEAFVKRDLTLAAELPKMDDEIDRTYREHVRNVLRVGGAVDIRCSASATLILRYLERIADHATYIAGSVVYIVTGKHPQYR
jgi:phosphate transport system protein